MLGSRVGSFGELVGSVIGSAGDDEAVGGIPGVTRDGQSGLYVPASLAEWTSLMSAAGLATGNPSAIWLLQEPSGNPADSSGNGFTLTAGGTGLTYQAGVTGMSRQGIAVTDGATGVLNTTSVSLADPAAASLLLLAYVVTGTAAANHGLLQIASTTTETAQETAAGLARITAGANTAPGAADSRGPVRPWVLQHNFTASAQALYTNQNKVVPTFSALSGKRASLGATAATAAPGTFAYGALFMNAAAELTSAQVKTLLTTLGFSGIPWS